MDELREPYKNNEIKTYDDLKEFFVQELEINYSREDRLPVVGNEYTEFRVWLLFVDDAEQGWACVQVAQSKNNLKDEIEFVIQNIFDGQGDIDYEVKDSQFYKNVCPIPKNGEDYRTLLYHVIGRKHNICKICVLNVDQYLGIEKVNSNNESDAERIIEICKNQYAEAKIAYQTLSKYWRKVSSAIDGQTIAYVMQHKNEFE